MDKTTRIKGIVCYGLTILVDRVVFNDVKNSEHRLMALGFVYLLISRPEVGD